MATQSFPVAGDDPPVPIIGTPWFDGTPVPLIAFIAAGVILTVVSVVLAIRAARELRHRQAQTPPDPPTEGDRDDD